ncbi:hypothetical protein B6S12_02165 [Helicobacter valdiviensis]|uniref:Uncharacterized protein n=1 Tax=Helicobacter valdiviensis TaxID=1458358 RepID=A0A2W6MW84_9HELI|nr:hypothetical protein [Helicobacter valdiviensis]PZT48667.1 hypothetical protein B6S12_02165 [Helicobacter valdiviensis]
MIILNHSLLETLEIKLINTKEELENTLPSDFLVIGSLELAKFAKLQGIDYAFLGDGVTKALMASSLGAKYLLCKKLVFAKQMQKIAENYLLDMKIISIIHDEKEIEEIATDGIDGVIFWNN